MPTDRSVCIFGNSIDQRTYAKACQSKEKYAKRFDHDPSAVCHLKTEEAPVIGERFGALRLSPAEAEADPLSLDGVENPIAIGTIRMGFGHYRIAMAMASAARALGYTPLWFDLMGFPNTTATKLIAYQNDLYSMASRLSQRFGLFNKLFWEPLNSEGFRKLTYNAQDQKASELMCAPYGDLPRDIPFVATHAWPAQAAIHAGLTRVVNAVPDNWPMALHLAEGAKHAVQTPSSYYGYKALRGMDKRRQLVPMPDGSLFYTGHYVDHELVLNIPFDCERRCKRAEGAEPIRYLLTIGGAGAQKDLFRGIIEHLLPYVRADKAALLVNVGDHAAVWGTLKNEISGLSGAIEHFNNFERSAAFAESALDGEVHGVHAFGDSDIFAAVYMTNLLMRASDLLVTKPSELSFYPVPKLMIRRVGGHEAWGAVRAAEVGDGTYELQTLPEICAWIDLVQSEPGVIVDMCDNIEAADAVGTYDGAYRAVQLAQEWSLLQEA